ncbi:glycoside hydrolase family 75 protein [Aulographum hederae CBS 113979]|uniref:Endo-chitosanase n=1 Tax=Aulographum hederae CBS 113979 TaxID=1176131 RepID=A0A6G1HDI5_9PEZI|nr:glycoside hydrolase family 75 protein [Aulographum hederae CBS 113979]
MSYCQFPTLVVAALAAAATTSAIAVPANVQTLYNNIKNGGACSDQLATGFYSSEDGPGTYSYCADTTSNILYIKGPSTKLANMDIDCDGTQDGPGDDGRCGSSDDTQGTTSFADTVAGYNKGVDDLNAYVHPYVVFGNADDSGSGNYETFDPREYGVEPLSLMAVVCGDKLIYGIWGDENGSDDEHPMVGEASLSLATACFGTSMNGNNGHDEDDVLYIAFPGSDAVPGADGAAWNAQSYAAFESSIVGLGNTLIGRIGGGGGGEEPGETCSWEGHCLGASCQSGDDCSDDLICTNGACANP